MIRFASLGSGSQGNALIVDAGETKLLLDCGFSVRATIQRLARIDVLPDEISAILVTHEHGDHVAGVFRFASRFAIPVYLTHGTLSGALRGKEATAECRLIDGHQPFAIDGLQIFPYPVPHDAKEPVQYLFSDGKHRLGVLTDSGSVTPHIVETLRACDALVLECNHDAAMLAASAYPASLKQRISGRFGHLDNTQAASLLKQIDPTRLQHIVAAHLSEQNNSPALVMEALASVLNCSEDWVGVADQSSGFAWRQLF